MLQVGEVNMFDAKKAADLAASILLQYDGSLTVLKLTKLLYICDRESIRANSKPITFDKCTSMPHGPVLSRVYNMTTGCASPAHQAVWDAVIAPRDEHNISLRKAQTSALNDLEQNIVEGVCEKFRRFTGWDLVQFTHENFEEWKDPNGSSFPIEPSTIYKAVGYGKRESSMLVKEIYQEDITTVNFDLERMKQAVESPSVRIPHGLKGNDLTRFILEQAQTIQ